MICANRRIVVVEDDASMLQAVERILRTGGCSVAEFRSGEEAIESGTIPSADCLVFDIHLPGMSGFELYRSLAARGAVIPVIFITAHDAPGARQEAERVGASAYLLKPFSGLALLRAVTDVLRRIERTASDDPL